MAILFYIILSQLSFANNQKINEYLKEVNFQGSYVLIDENTDNIYYYNDVKIYLSDLSMLNTIYIINYLNKYNYLNIIQDIRYLNPILRDVNEKISVRNLLEHKSGISEEIHHKIELKSTPGTNYDFNYLNYTMLYQIIESVSDKSYLENFRIALKEDNLVADVLELNSDDNLFKGANNQYINSDSYFEFYRQIFYKENNLKSYIKNCFTSYTNDKLISNTSEINDMHTAYFIYNIDEKPQIILLTSENDFHKDFENIKLILEGKEPEHINYFNVIFGGFLLLALFVGIFYLWKYEPIKN